MIKRQHENVEDVCEKISRKKLDFSVLSVAFLCIQKAAAHAEKLLKLWSKFQVFIWYSFRVIIFLMKTMKEGAVDPLNGRHFNAGGYLNIWKL